MNKAKQEKKDDVLNIFFAFLKITDNKDEIFISKDEVEELLSRITCNSEKYGFINEYDYPDLSSKALKRNKYINYVNLGNEISFSMPEEDAKAILDRNQKLIWIIHNLTTIDGINDDLKHLTNNSIVFNCQDPNTSYTIGNTFIGASNKFNDLYTDGEVTILEDYDFYKRVKVDNATYTLFTATEDDSLVGGVITANHLEPLSIYSYLQEGLNFYKGINQGIYSHKDEHILIKRRQ